LGLGDLNDGVWTTLADFADLQSLGRVGSSSEALAIKRLAVNRAVSVIENNGSGAFRIAAKLRPILAGKHIHAGHITSLLSRPQWNVRVAVLDALRDGYQRGGVGDSDSVLTPHLNAVVEFLEDPDAQVRLAALRVLRLFAPRTSTFAARFAAVIDETTADSEAQRSFVREAFLALAAFGAHAVRYAEQIRRARGALAWSAEVEAACVTFAELGISFVPNLTASLQSKADPSVVHYAVRHDRMFDDFRVCLPDGIFCGADAHVFAIFEDPQGFMPDSLIHRNLSFKWSAWRTTVTAQKDSSFTLAEGRRRHFAMDSGSLEEHTISCGGYDASCTRFDTQKVPGISETVVSMARLNLERLEPFRRLGWSEDQSHIATCCDVLCTTLSDSDMQDKRSMLEGCSCVFCASVIQVI
jgi:hypothetical protein